MGGEGSGPVRPSVVAVDGPSGSGKSTVAREVAVALGWAYLDTGAMYRAVTLAVLRDGLDAGSSPTELGSSAVAAVEEVRVGTDPKCPSVTLKGQDVSAAVRATEVTRLVSVVSALPAVRRCLVAVQRQLLQTTPAPGVVAEGRDIGTVVAPGAVVKVYLTADPAVRARRRRRDPEALGRSVAMVQAELQRRDGIDSTRTASPLAVAADATIVDATHLDRPTVVAEILRLCRDAGLAPA